MSRGSPGTSSTLEDMTHTTPAVGSDVTPSQPHRPAGLARPGWPAVTGRPGYGLDLGRPGQTGRPQRCGAVGARLPAAARGPGPPGALGLALPAARPGRAAADRDRQPDRRRRLGRLAGGVHAPDRLGLGAWPADRLRLLQRRWPGRLSGHHPLCWGAAPRRGAAAGLRLPGLAAPEPPGPGPRGRQNTGMGDR